MGAPAIWRKAIWMWLIHCEKVAKGIAIRVVICPKKQRRGSKAPLKKSAASWSGSPLNHSDQWLPLQGSATPWFATVWRYQELSLRASSPACKHALEHWVMVCSALSLCSTPGSETTGAYITPANGLAPWINTGIVATAASAGMPRPITQGTTALQWHR